MNWKCYGPRATIHTSVTKQKRERAFLFSWNAEWNPSISRGSDVLCETWLVNQRQFIFRCTVLNTIRNWKYSRAHLLIYWKQNSFLKIEPSVESCWLISNNKLTLKFSAREKIRIYWFYADQEFSVFFVLEFKKQRDRSDRVNWL